MTEYLANSGVLALKNQRLVQLRGNRTQKQMADEMGIPASTYAMIEAGHRFPRKKLQKKIADHFHTTVDYLFFQTDDTDGSENGGSSS